LKETKTDHTNLLEGSVDLSPGYEIQLLSNPLQHQIWKMLGSLHFPIFIKRYHFAPVSNVNQVFLGKKSMSQIKKGCLFEARSSFLQTKPFITLTVLSRSV